MTIAAELILQAEGPHRVVKALPASNCQFVMQFSFQSQDALKSVSVSVIHLSHRHSLVQNIGRVQLELTLVKYSAHCVVRDLAQVLAIRPPQFFVEERIYRTSQPYFTSPLRACSDPH